MAKKSLEELIGQALDNIEHDRQVTEEMLNDLQCYLKANDSRYAEVGNTAAKFVETLQRSNEQIVKLAALVHKKETVKYLKKHRVSNYNFINKVKILDLLIKLKILKKP